MAGDNDKGVVSGVLLSLMASMIIIITIIIIIIIIIIKIITIIIISKPIRCKYLYVI